MLVRIDNISIYVVILCISVAMCLITSISCFRRRPAFGALPLGILLLSVASASFFQVLVFVVQGFSDKLLVSNLRYIGVELIPVSFLALTYEHTKKLSFSKTKRVLPLLLISFMFFLLLATNRYHFLFYKAVSIQGNILILEDGIGFWLNIIYIYFLTIAGILYLLINLLNYSASSKRQTIFLLLSAIIPFMLSMISNFHIVDTGDIDITPLAFSLTGLLSFFCLFKLRMFDVIPIAKGELFESLQDSVIILDKSNIILAINKQAANLFDSVFGSACINDYIGKTVFDVFGAIENFTSNLSDREFLKDKVSIHVGNEIKYFIYSKTRSLIKRANLRVLLLF